MEKKQHTFNTRLSARDMADIEEGRALCIERFDLPISRTEFIMRAVRAYNQLLRTSRRAAIIQRGPDQKRIPEHIIPVSDQSIPAGHQFSKNQQDENISGPENCPDSENPKTLSKSTDHENNQFSFF